MLWIDRQASSENSIDFWRHQIVLKRVALGRANVAIGPDNGAIVAVAGRMSSRRRITLQTVTSALRWAEDMAN